MRIFIDLEWDQPSQEVISLGMVSENDIALYAILKDTSEHPWIQKHVISQLHNYRTVVHSESIVYPNYTSPTLTKRTFHQSLELYLNYFDTVEIISDWVEDIAHLCQLMVTGPGTKIKTPAITFKYIPEMEPPSMVPHNALEDAYGIKHAYHSMQPKKL